MQQQHCYQGPGLAPSPIRLRVLSLGAGVQSTMLALLAAHGVIGPMPDCAIFADTEWEPQAVYDHLAWLTSPNLLPFPVHIVSAGNFRENLVRAAAGERWAPQQPLPTFFPWPLRVHSSRKDKKVGCGCPLLRAGPSEVRVDRLRSVASHRDPMSSGGNLF